LRNAEEPEREARDASSGASTTTTTTTTTATTTTTPTTAATTPAVPEVTDEASVRLLNLAAARLDRLVLETEEKKQQQQQINDTEEKEQEDDEVKEEKREPAPARALPTSLAFSGKKAPKISMQVYLLRLAKYLNAWRGEESHARSVGVRAVLSALVYIERLTATKAFELTAVNVHRVVATSALVATKFTEDTPISNVFWSKVAGVDFSEMCALEVTLCNALHFALWVKPEQLDDMVDLLEVTF